MEQYIPKSVIKAELDRKKIPFKRDIEDGHYPTYLCAIMDFEDFINTLEAKEVDLEKEIDRWQGHEAFPEGIRITPLPKAMEIVERTAKYFFELGMSVSNKVKKGD